MSVISANYFSWWCFFMINFSYTNNAIVSLRLNGMTLLMEIFELLFDIITSIKEDTKLSSEIVFVCATEIDKKTAKFLNCCFLRINSHFGTSN